MNSLPTGQRDGTSAAQAPPDPTTSRNGSPAPDPTTDPSRAGAARTSWAPVAVATCTMAALGLWRLARDSAMGNDEVATRWAARLSLPRLVHLLRHVDAVHGLYYLLMHAWMAVGTSPAVMRIPSVIAMMAAVAMTVIIGRRLTGSGWAGLFAGLIMALTPVISFYAQTARSYALVVASVLGSTLALLRAMEAEPASGAPITRRWLVYGALVTLTGYLNELSLLVLAAHAITVRLARPGRRGVAHWAAAAAGGALLVMPLALISSRQDGVVSWIPRPRLTDLQTLLHDYFGPSTAVAILLAGCAAVALLPARGPSRPSRAGTDRAGPDEVTSGSAWWSRGGLSLPSVAAPLLILPAALLILESLVARPLYVDRYVLYGEAGAALLAGAGAQRVGQWLAGPASRWPGGAAGRRALVAVPAAVVCVCVLLLQLGPQQRARTPDSRLFDFGGPARYVGANARPGDGVLFFTGFYRKARLGYPRDFRNTADFAMAVSPAAAGTFQGRDLSFAATRPLMLVHQRIWVIGRSPSAPLPPGPFRKEGMVLRRRFAAVAQRRFRGMEVTLWSRR